MGLRGIFRELDISHALWQTSNWGEADKVHFMAKLFYSILWHVVCPSESNFQEQSKAFSYDLWPKRHYKIVSCFPLSFALISFFSSLCLSKKPFQFTKKPFQFTLVPLRKPTSRPTDVPHCLVSFPFNRWESGFLSTCRESNLSKINLYIISFLLGASSVHLQKSLSSWFLHSRLPLKNVSSFSALLSALKAFVGGKNT